MRGSTRARRDRDRRRRKMISGRQTFAPVLEKKSDTPRNCSTLTIESST